MLVPSAAAIAAAITATSSPSSAVSSTTGAATGAGAAVFLGGSHSHHEPSHVWRGLVGFPRSFLVGLWLYAMDGQYGIVFPIYNRYLAMAADGSRRCACVGRR